MSKLLASEDNNQFDAQSTVCKQRYRTHRRTS
jgi:hypothetical protein